MFREGTLWNGVKDLAARLSIEEIAGLMMYSSHQIVPADIEGVVCTDWGITADPDPELDSFGSR